MSQRKYVFAAPESVMPDAVEARFGGWTLNVDGTSSGSVTFYDDGGAAVSSKPFQIDHATTAAIFASFSGSTPEDFQDHLGGFLVTASQMPAGGTFDDV